MKKLDEILEGVQTAAIAGHVNPDGDCVGSAMGVYLYLRDNFPADTGRCLPGAEESGF